MSSSGGVILIAGLAIVAGVLIWKRCEIDFMKPLCEGKGSAKMQAISKKIQEQYNFSPGTPARKAADAELNSIKNRPTYKPGQILPPAKSLFATTRLSI